MTLKEAIKNYEIHKILKRIVDKRGKEKEIQIDRDEISDDIEGRIGIRDINEYGITPIERLIFVIDEKGLKNESNK